MTKNEERPRPVKAFSLPPTAIDRLEEIADFWCVSKSNAVARLILDAKIEGLRTMVRVPAKRGPAKTNR